MKPEIEPRIAAISWWKYTRALAPAIIFWLILIGTLGYLLWSRGKVGPENDDATMREWLDETRVWRKALPELLRDYLIRLQAFDNNPDDPQVRLVAEEIQSQLEAMTDPLRAYPNQLPMFPEVFRIEIDFTQYPDLKPIAWDSPVPRPRRQNRSRVRHLHHDVHDNNGKTIALIRCEYRLHAFNKLQRDEEQRQTIFWLVSGVTFGGSTLAFIWVYLFLQRERKREMQQMLAEQAREHAEVQMLEARLDAQAASVDAAKAETRAAEAERTNLEMKSQIYASIGIMAGSYAHNIKNLLVRPNDLLNRCLEQNSIPGEQVAMLQEVKGTLGTVTERLQEILRTVRRDPTKGDRTRLDLNNLVKLAYDTWRDIARDKWKIRLGCETANQSLIIEADYSHLQQAIENLVFNARDATFEMRNYLRDAARAEPDAVRRKQAIIDAAAWKGEVILRAYAQGDRPVLEVRDNGIGMTPEVREKCLETHFSTKRDNALYEGLSAGMGLGLSFVAMVLEHHAAQLQIESNPQQGAVFRMIFTQVT